MPIRFSCKHCGQRLRVSSRKAGGEVQCPKCREPIRVPAEGAAPPPADSPAEEAAPAPATPPPESGPPLSEFVVYDDDVEWVYESDEPDESPANAHQDTVTIPRSVLYAQGVLLGVVALIAFMFGVLVGGNGSSQNEPAPVPSPCILAGRVEYAVGNRDRPDDESVVIALPEDYRPANHERAPIEGLRPLDPLPHDTNTGLRAIHTMGGAYARTDEQGAYRLRVPRPGRYFLLIVSRNTKRADDEDLNRSDVAQLGRYFMPATELLGDQAYDWQTVAIQRDRTLDHRF